jgi:hypothetical protein
MSNKPYKSDIRRLLEAAESFVSEMNRVPGHGHMDDEPCDSKVCYLVMDNTDLRDRVDDFVASLKDVIVRETLGMPEAE